MLRALGSTAALVAIYYLLPLDRSSIGVVIGILAVGLLALVGLAAFPSPRDHKERLSGVGGPSEPSPLSVPLFLLLFAGTYFVMGTISAGTFSQPMTRTYALYFTVTVFSTVGFGDITAVTEPARVLVTGQMIADIVIIGLGVRIIIDAVKAGAATDASGRRCSRRRLAPWSRPHPGTIHAGDPREPACTFHPRWVTQFGAPSTRSSVLGQPQSLQTAWAVVKTRSSGRSSRRRDAAVIVARHR